MFVISLKQKTEGKNIASPQMTHLGGKRKSHNREVWLCKSFLR